MALFEWLSHETQRRGLDFLVIGGLAVNFYGYSRDTADVDLLVSQEARTAWVELLSGKGYIVEQDAGAFMQLTSPLGPEWPIDLMLVQQPTFQAMLAAAREVEMLGAPVRIPSLDHLIALKLHALKHGRAHRFLKDFQDIGGLARIGGLDLTSEKVRQLSEPAQTTESQAEPRRQPADLELPVSPDFTSRPPRIDPQAMLKRCAETMAWRNSRPGERERRLADKIDVEFVL